MKQEQKIYIKGNHGRGGEIIKILEDLGGRNSYSLTGNIEDTYYFIDPKGVIDNVSASGSVVLLFIKEFYNEVKLQRWKPKYREDYYSITDRGDIVLGTWDNTVVDKRHYDFGNCFRTFEEAEAAENKIKELLNEYK